MKVISGKDRGKIGTVSMVLRKSGKIVVEKVNVVKKHKKQTGEQKDQGGIIEVESPIPQGKVMIVCSKCNKPTRIGYKKQTDKKVRICKKCDKVLDE